jgi:uncharacterized protein involved in type VI secretion and phage assembly
MEDVEALVERAVEAVVQRLIGGRVYGVVYATVDSLDEKGCTLIYSSLPVNGASARARIATPAGGKDRGIFWRPEVKDEVVVAFENGDPSLPVVVGCVYNPQQTPPSDADTSGSNNKRMIVSRTGSAIVFDDASGTQKITIQSGSAKIEIDGKANEIKVTTTGATPSTKITLDGVSWNHQHATGTGPSGPPVSIGG